MQRTRDPDPSHADLRAPSALLMMLEGRAPLEFAALLAATPWLRKLPRGDGHPVVVFPGLAANDFSTLALRKLLDRLGYATHPWGQGFNFGPRVGVLARCSAHVRALFERDRQPVSLIGWSLGGIYARQIAKELHEQVRCVITLGTPFTGHPRATRAWRLFEVLSGQDVHDPAVLAQVRTLPPVPTTSIYSRSDGVVAWQCSVNEPAPLAENVEVHASHFGMGLNPISLYAIADRLAQPSGAWKPFDAVGVRRWFFRNSRAEPLRQPG